MERPRFLSTANIEWMGLDFVQTHNDTVNLSWPIPRCQNEQDPHTGSCQMQRLIFRHSQLGGNKAQEAPRLPSSLESISKIVKACVRVQDCTHAPIPTEPAPHSPPPLIPVLTAFFPSPVQPSRWIQSCAVSEKQWLLPSQEHLQGHFVLAPVSPASILFCSKVLDSSGFLFSEVLLFVLRLLPPPSSYPAPVL